MSKKSLTSACSRTNKPLRALLAADARRVCRAWHKTREVKVLLPGFRGAEG